MRARRVAKPLLVAAILIAALAIRVATIEGSHYRAHNDAAIYNKLAGEISQTGDYDTRKGAGGSRGPTAYFPPAFPYFLAVVDLLDGHEAGGRTAVPPERIAQAVLGTATVALTGLVALEAFGPAVAICSLILAAVYPVFIESSSALLAENLLVVFELAAIWTVLRARRASLPYAWIAAAGILSGLAALTHENALLMLLPLGVGVWAVRLQGGGRALGWALTAPALLVAMAVITIAPWTIRNAVELHHFVPVSDETGITLRGTYNPVSAAFKPVPYKWRFYFLIPQDHGLRKIAPTMTELQLGDRLQSRSLQYISAHPGAPFTVALHNTLRMFELEGTYAWQASATAERIPIATARIGVFSFWVVCVLALVGALTPLARRAPRWLWTIPVLFGLSVVLINVETPRFREPIDPFLILLAGCALAAAAGRIGRWRGSPPVSD